MYELVRRALIFGCSLFVIGRYVRFVLRLVTLEVLTRSAQNLAQINAISFLTLREKLSQDKSGPTACSRKFIPLAWQNIQKEVAVRDQFHAGISESIELPKWWKVRTKLKGRRAFEGRLFGALQSTIFGWKPASAFQGLLSFARSGLLYFPRLSQMN